MVDVNKNIRKVCSFYASDWHLITMLLPHVNKSINEENKITTILEENAQDKVETLLSKLRIPNEKEILKIGWKERKIEVEEIQKIIEENANKKQDIEIIISGKNEYIEKVNNIIDDYVSKNEKAEEINIKIVNCYYVENISNIKEILNNHDAVLNTAGEKSTSQYLINIGM